MLWFQELADGIKFRIRVQPRASGNQICGLWNDALKVRITAPPVEGEANEACIKLLAKIFGVSTNQVAIVSGETSRSKTVFIKGVAQVLVEQLQVISDQSGN